jgi:ATP-dependent 26S proteasome regulatory subunit
MVSVINYIIDDYNSFKLDNIYNNYLLIGSPGNGKTSIINSILHKINCKSLIIDSSIFKSTTLQVIKSNIDILSPDFIIFEDFDRIEGVEINDLFSFIDAVKLNNKISILFSANSFDGLLKEPAMQRKGRIDKIIEIPHPTQEDKKEMLNHLFEEYCIDKSKLTEVLEDTDILSRADIRDLCINLKHKSYQEYKDNENKIKHLKDKYHAPNVSSI